MACDYGVQDLWLCMAGFVEPKGIGFCQPFQGTPISATFMCRIYLVAYKFRFDFILWREPFRVLCFWLQCHMRYAEGGQWWRLQRSGLHIP